MIARRRAFLDGEIAKERATLAAIRAELPGRAHRAALSLVGFAIQQFAAELRWLDEIEPLLGRDG